MAKLTKKPSQRTQWPVGLVVTLLALLTVVVLALSGLALTQGKTPQSEGIPTNPNAAPSTTPTAEPGTDPITDPVEPSVEPTPEPTDTETPNEPTIIAAVVPDRLLTPVTDEVLVRSLVGTCTQPGSLDVSTDSGETWVESVELAATNSTKHLRVIPTRANMIQLVALDADCKPQLVRTANQGESWQSPVSPEGAWFFNPEVPTSIEAPDGPVPAPCEAVALAATGDNAAVLCADSSIITTNDKAATWKSPVQVPGAIAINFARDGYIVATANQNECVGLQTLELKGAKLGSPSACLEADIKEGTVAVARTSGSVLVWSGDKFATSTDGGDTWRS